MIKLEATAEKHSFFQIFPCTLDQSRVYQ